MLGHPSATLTLDRYGHSFDGELDAVADYLDEAIKQNRCGPAPMSRVEDRSTGR